MLDKKIEFNITDKDHLEIWPNPKPALKFIPEDYKKLGRLSNNNLHDPTVKTCMPFLDAMTAGYIIPFEQDYIVDPTEDDFSMTPANKQNNMYGMHPKQQLTESMAKKAKENAGKFHNKWLIRTPPGYSCLFVHPLNRVDDRFEILSGVVETDTYINTVNFPFILKKRDNQFLFKRGEPMVQVIPFKRESWKMWSGFKFEKEHSITDNKLGSLIIDRYKRFFWRKKTYK